MLFPTRNLVHISSYTEAPSLPHITLQAHETTWALSASSEDIGPVMVESESTIPPDATPDNVNNSAPISTPVGDIVASFFEACF